MYRVNGQLFTSPGKAYAYFIEITEGNLEEMNENGQWTTMKEKKNG